MAALVAGLSQTIRGQVQGLGTWQVPDPATLAVRLEMPEAKILKISKEPISMAAPVGDDDDSQSGDFIEDAATIAPIDAAGNASLRDACADVLDTLTPREATLVRKLRHPSRSEWQRSFLESEK